MSVHSVIWTPFLRKSVKWDFIKSHRIYLSSYQMYCHQRMWLVICLLGKRWITGESDFRFVWSEKVP